MKKQNQTERKEKRRALRPWRGITIWCLLLALSFGAGVPVMHILDNDFMLCLPGSTWRMKHADPSAIYYPAKFSDEAEALAYGESVARQVSEEGIVLLTNRTDALPLPEGSRLSLFSTSSVNPVLGGTGSGRVDSNSSDTLKEALEKEGFVVNPLFFPGGDIGKLAVCGTVNDIAMCGAGVKAGTRQESATYTLSVRTRTRPPEVMRERLLTEGLTSAATSCGILTKSESSTS